MQASGESLSTLVVFKFDFDIDMPNLSYYKLKLAFTTPSDEGQSLVEVYC